MVKRWISAVTSELANKSEAAIRLRKFTDGAYSVQSTRRAKLRATVPIKQSVYRFTRWLQPIYVGEATRKGGRKGGVLAEGPPGKAIFERLGNHADSIQSAANLKVRDFWCRFLVLKDFFIPLCESLLIDRYEPIWNKLIDGFGNKALGGPRQSEQQKSMWDVLHPGRPGAAIKPNKKYPEPQGIVSAVQKFFAGEPIPLIPTDKALDAAEKAGETGEGSEGDLPTKL